jgi:hypothetical protein
MMLVEPRHARERRPRPLGRLRHPASLRLLPNGLRAWHRLERGSRVGPTAFALAHRQCYPLLRQPPDHIAPSVVALLVHLITRRPCAFLVPLVDGVKGNIEQRRNLISGEGALWLSAGRFAGLRHVYRSDLGRWAVRLGAGPQCCHCSILHIPIVAAYTQPATAGLSPHLAPSAAFAAAVREIDRVDTASPTGRTCHRAGRRRLAWSREHFRKPNAMRP